MVRFRRCKPRQSARMMQRVAPPPGDAMRCMFAPTKPRSQTMATWHQLQRPTQLFHDTYCTVVIDPPHEMRALYRTATKALAEVYMRNLKANNPHAHAHAYILKPARTIRRKT